LSDTIGPAPGDLLAWRSFETKQFLDVVFIVACYEMSYFYVTATVVGKAPSLLSDEIIISESQHL